MAKISFADILSGFSTASALNQNFNDLEAEFQDKVLYRDNPAGEPNQMENDLDMNSNQVLNATTDLTDNSSLITVGDADGRYVGSSGTASDSSNLDGQPGSYYTNASNLDSGTVPTDRLSGSYDISITGNAATATTSQSSSNSFNLNGNPGSHYLNRANHTGTQTLSTISDAGAAASAGVKNSVEIHDGDIHLKGDQSAAGGDKYYGTDASGIRGFYDVPQSLSGSTDWGEIQGTLSDQTDLQSALDTKLDTSVTATELPEITWHGQSVTSDVTIPANQNAASFGPTMGIDTGVTVTVGSGSFWSIVEGEVV